MNTLCTLILAVAGISMAMPNPHNYVSNGQCPAGCDAIVTESQNPDPHQLYFFQRMTVSPINFSGSRIETNVYTRTLTSAALMEDVRSPKARSKAKA